MIFAGVRFSFERWYQAVGRIYRYGQKRDVNIHLVYSETEGNVTQILKQKQAAFAEMQAEMNEAMKEHGLFRKQAPTAFAPAEGVLPIEVPEWIRSHA
jgi:superfamily II DNA or RNA helicase